VSMYQLMENAGAAVFQQLLRAYPNCQKIIVLAGHGNNGGDAYVVARLALEKGLVCTVCELGNSQKLSQDARRARDKWLQKQGQNISAGYLNFADYDVCIDGMLGTGINGQVKSPYAEVIYQLNHSGIRVISIDVPSGMNSDTGTAQGIAVQASQTCTFVGIKAGLATGVGKQFAGSVKFFDLGVGNEFQRIAVPVAKMVDFTHLPAFPRRQINVHKGALGKLLCIGGNESYGGAIRLTAEAGLRMGAGLVKVFCHESSRFTVNGTRPEIMVETRDEQFLESLNWASAVVIGPGLGQTVWAIDLLTQTLSHCMRYHKHLVIDADALNLVAENPRLAIPQNLAIMTPHAAEAGRLLSRSVTQIEAERYAAAHDLTQKYDAVAVLKGAGTLISSQENTWVCQNGNPGMATAGMGDVLSGVLGALLAQGMSSRLSALYGVCLHSYSADLATRENGQIGLLAGDLFPYIRQLINAETHHE